MTSNDIFCIPKLLMRLIGLNPMHQSKWTRIYVFSYILLNVLFTFLCVIKAEKVRHEKSMLPLVLESIGVFVHYWGKLASPVLNQNRLLTLFKNGDKFWKIDKFAGSEVVDECKFILKSIKRMVNVLFVMSNLVMVVFFLDSLLKNNGELPILVHIPESWPFPLVAILQYALDVIIVETMLLSDCLFLCFCMEAVVQMKLLSFAILNIDFADKERIDKNLHEIIQHHGFVLDYCIDVGIFATCSFFAEFAVCTITVSFELYMTLESDDPNISNILRGFIYVMTLTLELTTYCITAEILSSQIQEFAYSAYSSNWVESHSEKLKKDLILLLLRTQKQGNFKAGGIIFINMSTFLVVFKTAFSFYTSMKAIS